MFKKYKKFNFTGRINAFRVIERLQRMNILGCQNTEMLSNLFLELGNFFLYISFHFRSSMSSTTQVSAETESRAHDCFPS